MSPKDFRNRKRFHVGLIIFYFGLSELSKTLKPYLEDQNHIRCFLTLHFFNDLYNFVFLTCRQQINKKKWKGKLLNYMGYIAYSKYLDGFFNFDQREVV